MLSLILENVYLFSSRSVVVILFFVFKKVLNGKANFQIINSFGINCLFNADRQHLFAYLQWIRCENYKKLLQVYSFYVRRMPDQVKKSDELYALK